MRPRHSKAHVLLGHQHVKAILEHPDTPRKFPALSGLTAQYAKALRSNTKACCSQESDMQKTVHDGHLAIVNLPDEQVRQIKKILGINRPLKLSKRVPGQGNVKRYV